MSKRQETSAATRGKVVEAAQALFHHHGYEAVTMRMVAKGAGVSTGAIFAHFDGKEALFVASMGAPAPDMQAFLTKVAGCTYLAPNDLKNLAEEAETLRKHIVGHHS